MDSAGHFGSCFIGTWCNNDLGGKTAYCSIELTIEGCRQPSVKRVSGDDGSVGAISIYKACRKKVSATCNLKDIIGWMVIAFILAGLIALVRLLWDE